MPTTKTHVRLIEISGRCHNPRCGETWSCWSDKPDPGRLCRLCGSDNTTEKGAT
jgi:hypothetical protein